MNRQNLVLIGEQYSGKTSLFTRFFEPEFSDEVAPTDRIQMKHKLFTDGGKSFEIHVCDTFAEAHAIIIVVDLSSISNFKNLNKWVEKAKNINKNALIFVVGTKSDKVESSFVKIVKNFCKISNLGFFETSSFNFKSVEKMFLGVFKRMTRKTILKARERQPSVSRQIKRTALDVILPLFCKILGIISNK
eukprot:gene42-4293_t